MSSGNRGMASGARAPLVIPLGLSIRQISKL